MSIGHGIAESFVDLVTTLMSYVAKATGQSLSDYCEIETVDDTHTLVGTDGSLATIIQVHGVNYLVGEEEYQKITDGLSRTLQSYVSTPGFAIQVFFMRDTDGVRREIDEMFAPALDSARRINMDMEDIFSERAEHLSRFCAREKVFIVLWTTPGVLTSPQKKEAKSDRQKYMREHNIPPMAQAQNPAAAMDILRDRHQAFFSAIHSDMTTMGVRNSIVDVHDALREIRMNIDPDFTDKDWSIYLPGDKIPVRAPAKKGTRDISHVMWPTIGSQIFPRDAEIINSSVVAMGDKIYTPLFIDLPPKETQPFAILFKRVNEIGIPWRISFLLESDGLRSISFKSMLATILSFSSSGNKLLTEANKDLTQMAAASDDAAIKLRISITTWADRGEEKMLRRRASSLARAIEGWGGCSVREATGDPLQGTLSSAMGISTRSIATTAIAPLREAIMMLPILRPASPWDHGAVLFRSPDGKPLPFQPGSSLQTTWIDIFFAKPGSGKSVLLNMSNLALCVSPGIKKLPRIAIIDIGPSSAGLISLLQDALPDDMKHLAAYHRLKMDRSNAINPFDTQLGCRIPTTIERSFLKNFLTLLATPVGVEMPYDGIADMAGMIIDEVFYNLSDDRNPKRFADNVEPELTKKLIDLGMEFDSRTTWWETIDYFFSKGLTHEAGLAQRHASPLLSDVVETCRSDAVNDVYGKVKVISTGENLVEAFSRLISAAVREYPILNQPTQFDIGEARIVSLDLDEVAKGGGPAGNRQTAVMYMLARYIMARHFYLNEDHVNVAPQAYREYHADRVREIRQEHKRICYDEFHRTSTSKTVRDQVVIDMREGRKWGVHVTLLSQSVDDFDSLMIEFATAIFIMDGGNRQTVEKLGKLFGLSEAAMYALEHRVTGPKPQGVNFLAQFSTKNGINTQLLTSTVGPYEMWAFSTTVEDVAIRNKLYQLLGAHRARKVLAEIYPSGSAKSDIEKRKSKIRDAGDLKNDGTDLIGMITEELMDVAHRRAI